jgi:hypothetical protein
LVEVGSPASLTIPNAKCPVCGCRVFFYQNEYGSRVFFDDLGPPWPKHPCTDNSWYASPASGKIVAAGFEEERPRRKVAVEEWQPCVIYRKNGSRLILKELGVDKFVRLALSPENLSSVFPVGFIREVSKRVLKLSYVHACIRFERHVYFEILVRRDYASVKARKGSSLATAQPLAIENLPFDPAFLTRVDELELSVRTANCLRNDNIAYIGNLVQKTEAEMLRTPNFGRKSLNEIKEVLAQMDLHLDSEVPGWPPENIEALADTYATRVSS